MKKPRLVIPPALTLLMVLNAPAVNMVHPVIAAAPRSRGYTVTPNIAQGKEALNNVPTASAVPARVHRSAAAIEELEWCKSLSTGLVRQLNMDSSHAFVGDFGMNMDAGDNRFMNQFNLGGGTNVNSSNMSDMDLSADWTSVAV
ncbi:hypothetical protein PInf_003754 [Phytophthora infestans]|nr:hypothetical protein PInf_003754 [Phytophthora infestans]